MQLLQNFCSSQRFRSFWYHLATTVSSFKVNGGMGLIIPTCLKMVQVQWVWNSLRNYVNDFHWWMGFPNQSNLELTQCSYVKRLPKSCISKREVTANSDYWNYSNTLQSVQMVTYSLSNSPAARKIRPILEKSSQTQMCCSLLHEKFYF